MAGRQPSPIVPAGRVDENCVEAPERDARDVRENKADQRTGSADGHVVPCELKAGQVDVDADHDAVAVRPGA